MSKKTCVLLELKFLNYPLLYSGRWMVVGKRLSAVFVAGPGLINARTISKPVRVYTSNLLASFFSNRCGTVGRTEYANADSNC